MEKFDLFKIKKTWEKIRGQEKSSFKNMDVLLLFNFEENLKWPQN